MKYVFFSFAILVVSIFYICFDNYSNSIYVFDEFDLIPDYYYLECTKDCNIKSIADNFKGTSVDIKEFYPKNNLVVNDETVLTKLEKFYYEDVQLIIDKYKNILLKYGFYDDYDKVDVYGVVIGEIMVYGSKNDVVNFTLEFDNYKLINE